MRPNTTVFFHDGDADGWFAAYAARLAYGDQAELRGLAPGQTDVLLAEAAGRDVVVLDLGLARRDLGALAQAAHSLLVIDHHARGTDYAGAADDVGPLARLIYDPEQAACVLAWKHFRPDVPLPELYRYVADRDLWRWELPHSREVAAAIASYLPFGACPLETGLQTVAMCLASYGKLLADGEAILRAVQAAVTRLAGQAVIQNLAGVEVPCVNASTYQSELGEALLAAHPDKPFAALFTVRADGVRTWSLRSRSAAEYDVGALAATRGGGGHPCAAGFRASPDDPYAQRAVQPAPAPPGAGPAAAPLPPATSPGAPPPAAPPAPTGPPRHKR